MTEHPYGRWLDGVNNPSQYVGNEVHSVVKDKAGVRCRIALCFPDLYKIGMSHLGLKIIYSVVNRREGFWAERCFAPEPDLEEILRRENEPLRTLESHDPLRDFDIVGFSISTELCFTEILAMLELGGIPLKGADRGGSAPLVIGGGAAVFNPEPVADFFDLFLLGDAESALPWLMEEYAEAKKAGVPRAGILRRLAAIEGVYVPSLYSVEYNGPALAAITPLVAGMKKPRRAVLPSLSQSPFPFDMVIPYGQPVFDRLAVEIDRGCTGGCRFCQAGMTYRPVRERPPAEVLDIVGKGLRSTGFDDVSLASLSSGDYSSIEPVVTALMDRTEEEKVSVSLPSLRSGTLTENVIGQVARVRKTGFTITAEAGTERLRKVINKKIPDAEIIETARRVLAGGWRQLKLYFMIGLPTETDADVEGIAGLVRKIFLLKEEGRRFQGVNVGVSQFVPKAHTPFQWEPMDSMGENLRKKEFLRSAFRGMRGVQMKGHDVEMSYMEGVFSRGDRRLGEAVLRAYRAGCRLDGWSEYFKFDVWREAFSGCGINPDDYALRRRAGDEVLPWDHLDVGVTKKYLWRDLQLAAKGEESPDCRFDRCLGCGLPADDNVIQPVMAVPAHKPARVEEINAPVFRYRIGFRKEGMARYLSHLELLAAFSRALRRAGLPVSYSGGFHPHIKMAFGGALSVGVVSLDELVDVDFSARVGPDDIVRRMNAELEKGVSLYGAALLSPPLRSIQSETAKTVWELADTGAPAPPLAEVERAIANIPGLTVIRFEHDNDGGRLVFESTREGFLGKLRKDLPGFVLSSNRRLIKTMTVMANDRGDVPGKSV